MDSKLVVFAILLGMVIIAGCSSSSDNSYSAPPATGGAVAGGGCGRFAASENAGCSPVQEQASVSAPEAF